MPKKTWGIFDPNSSAPFRISRSKIDLFIQCPRCFYLDQVSGVKRPSTPPFTLNSAVDALLKKEFDIHRAAQTPHPMLEHYGVKAVPFQHKDIELWRDALKNGISYTHEPTNLFVRGGIDDVWINENKELHIVDYKATAKDAEINLDSEWQITYKRQVEIYQWLFKQNNFKVSDTAYFVYVNGQTDRKAFDAKLEFEVHLIPYKGNTDWVEGVLFEIQKCLVGSLPKPHPNCEYCDYRKIAMEVAMEAQKAAKVTEVKKKTSKPKTGKLL